MCSKKLLWFVLPHDFLQQVNVLGESLAPRRRERAGRQGPVVLVRFSDGHVTFVL